MAAQRADDVQPTTQNFELVEAVKSAVILALVVSLLALFGEKLGVLSQGTVGIMMFSNVAILFVYGGFVYIVLVALDLLDQPLELSKHFVISTILALIYTAVLWFIQT
ncbi:MAG: hypothetical protein ABEI06_09280 [Halobacteriaceae archaeon]